MFFPQQKSDYAFDLNSDTVKDNQFGNVVQALAETRSVWFPETGFTVTPVYKRDLLPAGTEFDGPLIVEQMDTTTVVPPKAAFRVDAGGTMHLELAADAQARNAQ